MFEQEKTEMIKAGIKMDRYHLIALSGGNVSVRMPSGEILITPSGMIYEDMVPEDILVMDMEANIIEGVRKASSDTDGILYIFKHRNDINSVIHTHQPYATALGLVQDEFEVNLTTLANACGGNVRVTPFSSAGSVDMGIDTIENLGDSKAVILANHGVIAVGDNLKKALCAAVYLEEAAKTYLAAKSVGTPKKMTKNQVQQAVELFQFYGQGTPVIPKELVKRI